MRIIIQGDWFDCQVIRDRVFLWDCDGYLVDFDWCEEIDAYDI